MTPHPSHRAEHSASRLGIVAAFAAIYLFWGWTFLALRYAVQEVPPLLTIATRCVGGALLLYAWLLWRGGLERPTRRQWATSAIAGAFLFVGGHGVLAWAEQRVSSGQAALFMTSIPLWLVLITSVRERRAPSRMVIAGLALGILGVALLVRGNGEWSGTLLDRLGLIGSGLSWAIGSVIARDGARPASAAQSTTMQLAAGGAAVVALSLITGDLTGWSPAQLTPRGATSVLCLVVAGTVLGFGAYTWLLRVTTPAAVGTYAFVNPVVALSLAWIVGDEPFSVRTIVAALIVLGAVVLIWTSSARGPRLHRTAEPPIPISPSSLRALSTSVH
ncbi:MAG TPA: EamA family transporter [Gemmatimonadales bacterium]|nr:EamA family transporter [Gemmatimonadales bacterium]